MEELSDTRQRGWHYSDITPTPTFGPYCTSHNSLPVASEYGLWGLEGCSHPFCLSSLAERACSKKAWLQSHTQGPLTRILRMAATISTLLLGLGTSRLPTYCGEEAKREWEGEDNAPNHRTSGVQRLWGRTFLSPHFTEKEIRSTMGIISFEIVSSF